jgi:hypothetical protein
MKKVERLDGISTRDCIRGSSLRLRKPCLIHARCPQVGRVLPTSPGSRYIKPPSAYDLALNCSQLQINFRDPDPISQELVALVTTRKLSFTECGSCNTAI